MSGGDINTFVVLDLETTGLLSEQFNTCAITEISLYAFSAKCLNERNINRQVLTSVTDEGAEGLYPLPPELPRVLNKTTLMINPRRMLSPFAKSETGLSNEMLEQESSFDTNTANCLNLFLGRLEQPVCLVAHNGWNFDYPIVRYAYEKLEMSLPSSVYCVDSLQAFRELDEKFDNERKKLEIELAVEKVEIPSTTSIKDDDPLEENSIINWQLNNETTPHRKDHTTQNQKSLSVHRSLCIDDFKPRTKYPPKGFYKLENIYKRCFNQEPINLHRAESDVEVLTKIILHYGLDFLAYCKERKQPFSNVPKLGSSV